MSPLFGGGLFRKRAFGSSGSVAQLGERTTENREVTGSTPVGATTTLRVSVGASVSISGVGTNPLQKPAPEGVWPAPMMQNGKDLCDLQIGKDPIPDAVGEHGETAKSHTRAPFSGEQRVVRDSVERCLKIVQKSANLIGRLAHQKLDGLVDIPLRRAINNESERHAL